MSKAAFFNGLCIAAAVVMCLFFLVLLIDWLSSCLRAVDRGLANIGRGLGNAASTCSTAVSGTVSAVRVSWFMLFRGKLTVRASAYLMALAHPNATPEAANKLAFSIDSYAATQLIPGALYHVNEGFNGNRLALISEARLRGFNG